MMERKGTLIVIGLAGLLAIGWFVLSFEYLSWDFRNNIWGPGSLILRGESAYDNTILHQDSNTVWFPQVIGLFFFFGLPTQYQATNLWLIFNVLLLIALTWFIVQRRAARPVHPGMFGVLLLGVFIFPPTIRMLTLGQVDVIMMTAMLGAVHALEKKKTALSALLFAISFAKPQLFILILPALAFHFLFHKKDWLGAAKLTAMSASFGLALTLPLWLAEPGWVNDFLWNLERNIEWVQPSAYSLLRIRFGAWGLAAWLILFITLLAWTLRLWGKLEPMPAMIWTLALTVIVCPYVWSWDFVLLLPLLLSTAVEIHTPSARTVLAIAWLACVVLAPINLQLAASADHVLWWLPLVLMAGIIVSLQWDNRSH